MYCPRIDHFVKIQPPIQNKMVKLCCHMVRPPIFENYDTMMQSEWVNNIRKKFDENVFPKECVRCDIDEKNNSTSVRISALAEHEKQTTENYLIADILLDNICNSGCQICSPILSTKIGSLYNSKNYIIIDNTKNLNNIPLDRIVELDIAGGEPSHSKNTKNLLLNLPKNVKKIRINTNGSRFMDELIPLLDKGIEIKITFSLDGIGKVQEYIRWPIVWEKYIETVNQYKELQLKYDKLLLDFWCTINVLNINDFLNIKTFAENINIPLAYSVLDNPFVLNIKYKNHFTDNAKQNPLINNLFKFNLATDFNNQEQLNKFIQTQDNLRKIDIKYYINFG